MQDDGFVIFLFGHVKQTPTAYSIVRAMCVSLPIADLLLRSHPAATSTIGARHYRLEMFAEKRRLDPQQDKK